MTTFPDIVITGWGAVGPSGAGREAVVQAFRDGAVPLREVDRSGGYHRNAGSRLAATIDSNLDLSTWISPRQARRMSPPSRLAVASARMAFEQADMPEEEAKVRNTAVVTSTSFGPSSYTEDLMRQILLDAPTAASPFLFSEAVANAPAAQIALLLGAKGPNLTITQRESGPLLAVAHGVEALRRGRTGLAVVAAADESNALLHSVLDRFGVLAGSRPTRDEAGMEEVARPFDHHRNGFVLGAGATALLLETATSAVERGARPLATIRATITAFDPGAHEAGWSNDPEPLARHLRRGLESRGIEPSSIGLVVAGAAGTREGDRQEALVLRRALLGQDWADLGVQLPPVLAPKAYMGEHGGASLAAAMLACEPEAADTEPLAATPGFREVDPELGLVPFQGGTLPTVHRILVSTLAAGGSSAWMILDL
ncbi:MAG: hypothetical protein MPN21_14445 [Thermoanaerobaculia bacterium]|nr:hypothetical protein [Thermoanaerobaculia bacterium]